MKITIELDPEETIQLQKQFLEAAGAAGVDMMEINTRVYTEVLTKFFQQAGGTEAISKMLWPFAQKPENNGP